MTFIETSEAFLHLFSRKSNRDVNNLPLAQTMSEIRGFHPSEPKGREGQKIGQSEAYLRKRLEQGVSPERAHILTQELTSTANFFTEAKIDFYIAGGSGLDLLNGTWDRDHQDLDIAIFGKDRAKFFDAASQAGFSIKLADHTPLSAEKIVQTKIHNAFVSRTNEQGTVRFEVLFINAAASGDIELIDGVPIPRKSYQNAPRVTIGGTEYVLQPSEIILFHKFRDGRRKDFQDIQKMLKMLSAQQHEHLRAYIQKAGLRFMIGMEEFSDLPMLLKKAQQKEKMERKKLLKKAQTKDEIFEDECNTLSEGLFALRRKTDDQRDFLNRFCETFGTLSPEKISFVKTMEAYLYQEPPPTKEAFKQWARSVIVLEKARRDFASTKLWTSIRKPDDE